MTALAVPGERDLGRFELRHRIFGGVEPFFALQLAGEFRHGRQHQIDRDRHVELVASWIGGIELQRARGAGEEAGEFAQPEMREREGNLGVIGLDLIGAGLDRRRVARGRLRRGRAGEDQRRAQRGRGEKVRFH